MAASAGCVRSLFLSLLLGLCSAQALAVQPDEMLADPALEKRARDISAGLRCLVCQNQSIDDSDAPLAADLRRLVRERLQARDTDQQVTDFIVARYGDFVLLKPPFKPGTVLLWMSPLIVLLGGFYLTMRAMRPGSGAGPETLSPEEASRLASILNDEKN